MEEDVVAAASFAVNAYRGWRPHGGIGFVSDSAEASYPNGRFGEASFLHSFDYLFVLVAGQGYGGYPDGVGRLREKSVLYVPRIRNSDCLPAPRRFALLFKGQGFPKKGSGCQISPPAEAVEALVATAGGGVAGVSGPVNSAFLFEAISGWALVAAAVSRGPFSTIDGEYLRGNLADLFPQSDQRVPRFAMTYFAYA